MRRSGVTRLRTISNAFIQSQALYTAARLRVADALADGPLPNNELAQQLGAHPERLYRVLRMLAVLGVFQEAEPGVWANNELSELLRQQGEETSMRDMVMHMGDETYKGFTTLSDSVLASHPSGIAFYDYSRGLDFWSWLNLPQHKEQQAYFDRAMKAASASGMPAILQEFDWSPWAAGTVADVGGGVGHVLAALLQRHQGMRGILLDRAPVIKAAQQAWQQEYVDLAPRVQLLPGSFFEAVPPADAYFLKSILHDWSDEQSSRILRAIRRSAPAGARLLLCEVAVPDELAQVQTWVASMDMVMMGMAGGKERTVTEWRQLLASSGFALERVVPLSSGYSMIVAAPAAADE
ncbi:hydroxyneurosporene methyltransferase [Chlorella sorokiniana]|uniref:Hydroxyneurosporene methyltransferase n=1 Tax=Chlorella sorokiniana TaxID=3076 RepID=A0A2P6TNL3_CHLSO|nr:hydroxyneurosporene methyltransferase [Chlorella sorokiniana]|eukprot:PRW50914.1 hydroxyneurosporene methyltransferase [Chlorella sorokiniana]